MTSTYDERNKWVNIEVTEVDDKVEFFFAPETLKLPAGWIGNIIWYVFTPGWELCADAGVVFARDSGFAGTPQPDETRAGCWSTPASNDRTGTFPYKVSVQRLAGPSMKVVYHADPVVENDPPAPERWPARHRESARRQNAS